MPPASFIPLAEETGDIVALWEWILRTACQQLADWSAARPGMASVNLAVNVSMRQLERDDIVSVVAAALSDPGLPAERLTLELTESALAQDGELARRQIAALAALGVRIAVDDFGTGYCSLAYLQRFDVHALKIDKSFIDDFGSTGEGEALAEVVLGVASALGMSVVAEGVETEQVAQTLTEMSCPSAQGFLYSRPLPAGAVPDAVAALDSSAVGRHKDQRPPRPPRVLVVCGHCRRRGSYAMQDRPYVRCQYCRSGVLAEGDRAADVGYWASRLNGTPPAA